MAPESVNGEMAGTAGDIFALGVVLYEMAAGRRPFRRHDAGVGRRQHRLPTQPVPLGRVNRGIPPAFDELVHADAAEGAGAAPDGEGGRAGAGGDP